MSTQEKQIPAQSTLSDCEREPIHIPGLIQPHGFMLVFEDSSLIAYSSNTDNFLRKPLSLSMNVSALDGICQLTDGLEMLVEEVVKLKYPPLPKIIEINDRIVVRSAHFYDGRVIVEFEEVRANPDIVVNPAHLFSRIKSIDNREELLQICCNEIRQWTGFDRVMAYVFLPDDSGEVVAESRADKIESFLNMRFPASDIPSQARRFYTLNTLRFIPDVLYKSVDLCVLPDCKPIDMSFAILQSVSPIHLEYLSNMGVRASMTISIVLDGRLWGLFACHHNEPLSVSPTTRQSCDMVAYFVASRIQAFQAIVIASRREEAAYLTSRMARELASADDPLSYLSSIEAEIRRILKVDALVLAWQGKLIVFGPIPYEIAFDVIKHFDSFKGVGTAIDNIESWPEDFRDKLQGWVGALSIEFDPAFNGRIIAMRREQIASVSWAGNPNKMYREGPNGSRLTPRGSFSEWRETVKGKCDPWLDITRQIAESLRVELTRVSTMRYAEIEDARKRLMAMLGHDLRDPLHTIRIAATVLKTDDKSKALASFIDKSSGRMQKLIAQVLDFSRAEAGLPMLGTITEIDLSQLVDDLVEESRLGHSGVEIETQLQRPAIILGDAERVVQAMSNLLSNARHHAKMGTPICINLEVNDKEVRFSISNESPPIPDNIVSVLFDPLKRTERAMTNRSGLGLGLYIAHRIVIAMGGDIFYEYRDGRVIFSMTLESIE